tara:strand:+ start:19484 stop:19612 length:129 start_codon:yes stop_codon:yes gene_type:complete
MFFSLNDYWKGIALFLSAWVFYNFTGFEFTVITLLTLIWLKK